MFDLKPGESIVVRATDPEEKTEEEITCPIEDCDQVRHGGDSWEASDSGEHECEKCGTKYKWSRIVDISYETIEIV